MYRRGCLCVRTCFCVVLVCGVGSSKLRVVSLGHTYLCVCGVSAPTAQLSRVWILSLSCLPLLCGVVFLWSAAGSFGDRPEGVTRMPRRGQASRLRAAGPRGTIQTILLCDTHIPRAGFVAWSLLWMTDSTWFARAGSEWCAPRCKTLMLCESIHVHARLMVVDGQQFAAHCVRSRGTL